MKNINSHPNWKNINPVKKPYHLLRLFLAKQYLKTIPQEKIVAVSGSVGKTTTVNACKSVLSEKMPTISSTETSNKAVNLDPIFNIPMTILRVTPTTKKAIFELGIEYPGEMEYFLSLIQPQYAIITRLSYEHTEYLENLENIISENKLLLNSLPKKGAAILNWDDENTHKILQGLKAETIFYGTDSKKCHVWAGNIRVENFKTVFELNYGVERVEVRSLLLGQHQIYPLLAAAALGLSCGMSLPFVKKGLEKVRPAPHRMEIKEGKLGSFIIDDSYNAQPVSVEEALITLSKITAKRKLLVLGQMKELGEFTEEMHRKVAHWIKGENIDLVIFGKGDTGIIFDELKKINYDLNKIVSDLSNEEIEIKLSDILSKGDVVLIKGARSNKLDEVVEKLLKKDHNKDNEK